MTARNAISLLVAGALLTGCMKKVDSGRLPALDRCHALGNESADNQRLPPATRLQEIARCRAEPMAYRHDNANHEIEVTTKLAWNYVNLGLDYEATHDSVGAARAYWSALEMDTRVLNYRSQLEQIRLAALNGLARSAAARNQPHWSALIAACGALTRVYLDGPDNAVDRIEEAKLEQDRVDLIRATAEAQAASNRAMAQIGVGVISNLRPGLSLKTGLLNNIGAVAKGAIQGVEVASALGDAKKRVAAQLDLLREVVAESVDDIPQIEAGKGFAGEQVAFYLQVSGDAGPYLSILESAADTQHWTGLKTALSEITDRKHPGSNDLENLAAELRQIEIDATKTDRRRGQ